MNLGRIEVDLRCEKSDTGHFAETPHTAMTTAAALDRLRLRCSYCGRVLRVSQARWAVETYVIVEEASLDDFFSPGL